MNLVETSRYEDIEPFISGKGILRRCMGDADCGLNPRDVVENPRNRFLLAYDESLPVGFLCFYPHGSSNYSMHLCLRTIGEKTKRIVAMALEYAKVNMGAKSIYAIYPSAYRSITALCHYFGLREDPDLASAFDPSVTASHSFYRLDLI